eukprot:1340689-Rhodomonas_salina.1
MLLPGGYFGEMTADRQLGEVLSPLLSPQNQMQIAAPAVQFVPECGGMSFDIAPSSNAVPREIKCEKPQPRYSLREACG